ncbi:MAG: MBL fold metallo-hydrolase [Phycisphaerae bacterium]|jgi:beta-lactamase superfamily II metal-dependent hydrolase
MPSRGEAALAFRSSADGDAGSTAASELEFHFIQVGQGDSTLVRCPNGDRILVDCGSHGEFDLDRVRSYLRQQLDAEDPKIDLLVVTHPDGDHYGEIEAVFEGDDDEPGIGVDRVLYVKSLAAHGESDFDDWLRDVPSSQRENLSLSNYNVFPTRGLNVCGPEVHVSVLAAGVESSFSSTNTASIVLLIEYGWFSALLTGDATRVTQEDILDRFAENLEVLESVELLKVAHHGSRATSMLTRANGTRWFDAIQPHVAVFSAAYNNTYGHPSQDVAEALEPYTIPAARHPLRFWKKKNELSSSWTVNRYRDEAMFLTATNGNFVLTTDGEYYDWTYED